MLFQNGQFEEIGLAGYRYIHLYCDYMGAKVIFLFKGIGLHGLQAIIDHFKALI